LRRGKGDEFELPATARKAGPGDDGNADTFADQVPEQAEVPGLGGDGRHESGFPADPLHVGALSAVRGECDHGLAFQVRQWNGALARQRMAGTGRDDERLAGEPVDPQPGRGPAVIGQASDRGVELAAAYRSQQFGRVVFPHPDIDSRVFPAELAEGTGQQAFRRAFEGPHGQLPGEQARQRGNGRLGAPGGRERGAGLGQQRLPGRGEPDAAPVPVEQPLAQLGLETTDLLADGRLSDQHTLGSTGEMALFGDRDEVLKLAQFHKHSLLQIADLYLGRIHQAVSRVSGMPRSSAPMEPDAPHALAPGPGGRSRPGTAHPWLALCTVALGLIMVLLDTSIVSVANATIAADLHGSLAGLQWVTSAFLLAIATGLVTGGKLGDHFGRRRLFACGAAGFALASAGCGLSASVPVLIGFRAVQGLAGAAMMPQTLATLRATFDATRFQLAVGVYVGLSSLSIAAGPIAGGVLVQDAGWRSIFFINVLIGPAAVVAARLFIPETRNPRSGPLDIPGALLLGGAMFCLVWALVNSGAHAWTSAWTLGSLAAAAIVLAAWTARMARAATPLIPLALFRSASFDAGIGVIITAGFAMFGTLFYLTLYLERAHGLTPISAGASMLPLTIFSGLAGPACGILARKIPLWLLLAGGLVLLASGAIGLRNLTPATGHSGLWPWLAMMGTGIGVALTGGSQAVVGSAPSSRAGIATGIQQTSLNIGGALATAVLGTIIASSGGMRAAFLLVASIAGMATLATVCFIRTPPRHA